MIAARDTIAAIASATGVAGVGVVRVSGPAALVIARLLLGHDPEPRRAHYCRFTHEHGEIIDDGLLLWFPAPHSYTGEAVLELQGHGNPVVLAGLLRRCLALGARLARPGEFTERAFLEGKLDLAQAEAVADLIAATSEAAVRAARRSLDGEFSRRVEALVTALTAARVWMEAALDFPDEDIDFLAAPELQAQLDVVTADLSALLREAERGKRLVDGLHVVMIGAPNAGKSSLLNALAGEERAIVTAQAGTTRDLLRETIRIDGIEMTLVDTAGLHAAEDLVEREGIRRARAELAKADLVLAVLDDRQATADQHALAAELADARQILWLHNKGDLTGRAQGHEARADGLHLWLSAQTGHGLDALREQLQGAAGAGGEGSFSARQRHLDALTRAAATLDSARIRLSEGQAELAAEELRSAQNQLGEITGRIDADALLGRIFADFCIGK